MCFFFNFCFVLFFPNTLIVRNKCVFLFNYTGRYLQLLPKHEKAAFLSFSLCLTGANEGLLMAIAYYFLFSKCTHRTVKKKKKKKYEVALVLLNCGKQVQIFALLSIVPPLPRTQSSLGVVNPVWYGCCCLSFKR